MKNMLTAIMLIFGTAIFILGIVSMIMSEQIVKSIQLCWSQECVKEFIDMLWRSLVHLLIGVLNMLLGILVIVEAVDALDDS
jgi:hypothetical protein